MKKNKIEEFIRFVNRISPISETLFVDSIEKETICLYYEINSSQGTFFIKNSNSFDKMYAEISRKVKRIKEDLYL